MTHCHEHELRAWHDGELSPAERTRVEQHLAACERCAAEAEHIRRRGVLVASRLASLDVAAVRTRPQEAHARLRRYSLEKEKSDMRYGSTVRRWRLAGAALALVLIVTTAFTFPPVRSLATGFLAMFRMNRVQVVSFDPQTAWGTSDLSQVADRLEMLLQDTVEVQLEGEAQQLESPKQALALSSFHVRLPAGWEDSARMVVQPSIHFTMTLDVERMRTMLNELGHPEVELPAALDGAQVQVDMSRTFVARLGACEEENEPAVQRVPCTVLIQMQTPEITAPDGLDLSALGKAYLQVLGMPADQAQTFSKKIDWATTLVIPFPLKRGMEYRDVQVKGAPAVFVHGPRSSGSTTDYALVWLSDRYAYALRGSGTLEDALRIAESMR